MPSFSTCVIGGGAAGISATLALRSAGSMVTCFEIAPTVGGLWNADNEFQMQTNNKQLEYQNQHEFAGRNLAAHPSPIYPSLKTVLPKEVMAFSDQPFPYLTPQFPHHSSVREYLQEYAVRKGVHALTRYNTRVIKVEWIGAPYSEWQETYNRVQNSIGGGGDATTIGVQNAVVVSGMGMNRAVVPRTRQNFWKVRTANMVTGDVHDWSFDSVVVAAGRHHRPRYPGASRTGPLDEPIAPLPKLPGQELFEIAGGAIRHSSEARRFRDFTGKTVIVVGNGIGAMEHVAELQRHGAFVIHSMTEKIGSLRSRFEHNVTQASDMSLPSRRALAALKGGFEKINKLNEKKLVRNILMRRNNKSNISLAGFFGNDLNNPDTSEIPSDSLASTIGSDPGLIGRYLPVPTIGAIHGFTNGRDTIVDVESHKPDGDGDGNKSGDNNKNDATAAEETEDNAWHPSRKRHCPILQYLEKLKKSDPHTFARVSQKLAFDDETGRLHILDVDAVIFATGYYRDFGFFVDEEIRSALEGNNPILAGELEEGKSKEKKSSTTSTKNGGEQEEAGNKNENDGTSSTVSSSFKNNRNLIYRDLYMGCLYRKNPTLGVLGLQAEMIPPFIMFEAQARFISHIFSRRVPFPPTEQEMNDIEKRLLGENAEQVLASPEGMGVGASAAYHDGLIRLCGLQNSLSGYYDSLLNERRFRWGGSLFLNVVNKFRELKPHSRKKQHTIISNTI